MYVVRLPQQVCSHGNSQAENTAVEFTGFLFFLRDTCKLPHGFCQRCCCRQLCFCGFYSAWPPLSSLRSSRHSLLSNSLLPGYVSVSATTQLFNYFWVRCLLCCCFFLLKRHRARADLTVCFFYINLSTENSTKGPICGSSIYLHGAPHHCITKYK